MRGCICTFLSLWNGLSPLTTLLPTLVASRVLSMHAGALQMTGRNHAWGEGGRDAHKQRPAKQSGTPWDQAYRANSKKGKNSVEKHPSKWVVRRPGRVVVEGEWFDCQVEGGVTGL